MSPLSEPPELIDTYSGVRTYLDTISSTDTLYIDLEGKSLSRHGTLTIVTIFVASTGKATLIDVTKLGRSAFVVSGSTLKTLGQILENGNITKYFWDLRNDADALWSHHQVRLAGAIDVQLMENASRSGDKTYLRGLQTCVEHDLHLGFMERHRWAKIKKDMKPFMSGDIFAKRPLADTTKAYCAGDVIYLPSLRDTYSSKLSPEWSAKVIAESERRVDMACSPSYDPNSADKKFGPWSTGSRNSMVSGKTMMTLDELLDRMEEDRMDALEQEYLGGYDDPDYYYDDDDFGKCSADAAFDDTFDSCWDKN
ncbi:ribonuclease H-like domain-containing protein [Xylariaceae sp. FL1019]|nr:ribonuclease H-like domain-containing protein [Xylariaceae sp. FL1019]